MTTQALQEYTVDSFLCALIQSKYDELLFGTAGMACIGYGNSKSPFCVRKHRLYIYALVLVH